MVFERLSQLAQEGSTLFSNYNPDYSNSTGLEIAGYIGAVTLLVAGALTELYLIRRAKAKGDEKIEQERKKQEDEQRCVARFEMSLASKNQEKPVYIQDPKDILGDPL